MRKDIRDLALEGATLDEVISAIADGEATEEERKDIKAEYDKAVAEIDKADETLDEAEEETEQPAEC